MRPALLSAPERPIRLVGHSPLSRPRPDRSSGASNRRNVTVRRLYPYLCHIATVGIASCGAAGRRAEDGGQRSQGQADGVRSGCSPSAGSVLARGRPGNPRQVTLTRIVWYPVAPSGSVLCLSEVWV